MPTFHCRSKEYEFLICSDIRPEHEGMALEMNELGEAANPILLAFRSDEGRSVTVTAYKTEIPLEVVECFILRVREELIEK